jgi:hypothetical protein
MKGAFPKILVNDIKIFPLPELAGQEDLASKLVKRTAKLAELAMSEVSSHTFMALDAENEHDIYKLYNLTAEEITMIEQYFGVMNTTGVE